MKAGLFFFGVVVGGALLAGAAVFGLLNLGNQVPKVNAAKPPLSCKDNTQKCEVAVYVDCSTTPCTLSVDYDYTIVNTDKKDIKLTWQLQDAAFAFTDKGIEIPDGGDQFEDCHPEGSGQRFRCKDKNQHFGLYKYKINVTGPKPVDSLDPWVVND
jgi:hypothetical protein